MKKRWRQARDGADLVQPGFSGHSASTALSPSKVHPSTALFDIVEQSKAMLTQTLKSCLQRLQPTALVLFSDGTVNAVLEGVLEAGLPLGILRLGYDQ
jgi:hypothetical protein